MFSYIGGVERAAQFQQNLMGRSKRVAVLCNSEFMVENLRHVTSVSGIHDQSYQFFEEDKEMVGAAYELLGIKGNERISLKK